MVGLGIHGIPYAANDGFGGDDNNNIPSPLVSDNGFLRPPKLRTMTPNKFLLENDDDVPPACESSSMAWASTSAIAPYASNSIILLVTGLGIITLFLLLLRFAAELRQFLYTLLHIA